MPRSFDYYAISDQDDVWLPDKLCSAVNMIEDAVGSSAEDAIPAIYTSNTKAVDEALNPLRDYDFTHRPKTLEALFVRFSYPAHVMVFNRALLREIDGYGDDTPVPFTLEARLLTTVLAARGVWVHDAKSHILWRRSDQTVTSSGKGFWARIKSEARLFCAKGNRHAWAESLLGRYEATMEEEDRIFLNHVVHLDDGLGHKRALLASPRFTTRNKLLDLRARARVLFSEW